MRSLLRSSNTEPILKRAAGGCGPYCIWPWHRDFEAPPWRSWLEAPSRTGTTAQENIAAWRAWGPIDEVWHVPGNHMTVLANPHVHALANRLREAMANPRHLS